jgi:DNA replication licensing factor MCM6
LNESDLVDWQRLHATDLVVRNEMVERAKVGDRVVLTGSLVVVPDGSAFARIGEAARTTSGDRGKEAASGDGGGVKGLGAIGVR